MHTMRTRVVFCLREVSAGFHNESLSCEKAQITFEAVDTKVCG